MKLSKNLIPKIFLILTINQFVFNAPKVKAAENIKIVYSIFSKIKVDSLKRFAEDGYASDQLKKF